MKVKILPSLEKYSESPLAAFKHGYLAVHIGDSVLVYKQNESTFSIISSVNTEKLTVKSMEFISSVYSTRLILEIVVQNGFYLFDVFNNILSFFENKIETISSDPLAVNSFICAVNENELTGFSYEIVDEFLITKNWHLDFEDRIKMVSISDYNPNFAILLTETSEVNVLKRENQKSRFQVFAPIYNLAQEESVDGVTCISCGFAIAWSKHFIHLIHLITATSITILRLDNTKYVNYVSNTGNEDLDFYVLFNDNSIDLYSFENSKLSTPQTVNLPQTFNFTPLRASKGEFVLINNYMKIYTIKKALNGVISFNAFYTLPVMKANAPVAKLHSQIAFCDIDGFLTSFNYKTGEYSFRYPTNVEKLLWMTKNSLLVINEGKLFLIEQDEQFKFNEIEIEGIKINDVQVKSKYIIISDKSTIVVYFEGKTYTKKVNDLNYFDATLDHNDKLVIAFAIKDRGIFFSNEEFKPILGSFPQNTSASYQLISASFPIVLAIDSNDKLYSFDLMSGECIAMLNYNYPSNIYKFEGNLKFAFDQKANIEVLDVKLAVLKSFPNNGQLLSISESEIVWNQPNGMILESTNQIPYNNFELNFFDSLKPYAIDIDDSKSFLSQVLSALSSTDDFPEIVDDFNMFIGKQPRLDLKEISSDVKRVYHRLILSFFGKELSESNIEQIKQFIAVFEQSEDYLGAALISLMINQKEKVLDYLMKAGFYELAHVFASLNDLDTSNVVDQFLRFSIRSGNLINGIKTLISMKYNKQAALLLYEHGYYKNLKYFMENYKMSESVDSNTNIEEIVKFIKERNIGLFD